MILCFVSSIHNKTFLKFKTLQNLSKEPLKMSQMKVERRDAQSSRSVPILMCHKLPREGVGVRKLWDNIPEYLKSSLKNFPNIVKNK